jgi:hypothetical protein
MCAHAESSQGELKLKFSEPREISIKALPFDKGSCRLAYWAKMNGKLYVAKRQIASRGFEKDRQTVLENVEMQVIASELAVAYSAACSNHSLKSVVYVEVRSVSLDTRADSVRCRNSCCWCLPLLAPRSSK